MKILEEYNDVKLMEYDTYYDERGYFKESYNIRTMLDLGITNGFVQDNISYSKQYVFRGLHYQAQAQSKLLSVVHGHIIDIVLDIRVDAPSFGYVYAIDLTVGKCLYIPKGYAHGFLALDPENIVSYKVDEYRDPEGEGCITYKEALSRSDTFCEYVQDIGEEKLILSERDKRGISVNAYLQSQLYLRYVAH
jgi:dTDP-4-dehydrorhamnose 3,5-epimerase